MALDIWIYGPGFGETLVLIWDESTGYALQLMYLDSVTSLPSVGNALVVVAMVGEEGYRKLHVRLFDSSGRQIVDKDEDQLGFSAELNALKELFTSGSAPDIAGWTEKTKQDVIDNATAVSGQHGLGSGGGGLIRHAGVIDSLGNSVYHPTIKRLNDEKWSRLAFVAATHPHLDHVESFVEILRKYAGRIDRILWWGGIDVARVVNVFDRLAAERALYGKEPGVAATHVAWFLDAARYLAGHFPRSLPRWPPVPLQSVTGMEETYSAAIPGGIMRLSVISPWLRPQGDYVRDFESQIVRVAGGTRIVPCRVRANRTSLAFLIQYGKAQVLLGGDMESDNWTEFLRTYNGEILNPCLIKASHHGSRTAMLPQMWNRTCGAFGAMPAEQSVCVITPWRKGDRVLPLETEIRRIAESGYRVVVTGTPKVTDVLNYGSRLLDSCVHVAVDTDGTAKILETKGCRMYG